jgi:hypothetical protein
MRPNRSISKLLETVMTIMPAMKPKAATTNVIRRPKRSEMLCERAAPPIAQKFKDPRKISLWIPFFERKHHTRAKVSIINSSLSMASQIKTVSMELTR